MPATSNSETMPQAYKRANWIEPAQHNEETQVCLTTDAQTKAFYLLGTFWVVFNAGGVHFNDS